jgi:hypothetical protein
VNEHEKNEEQVEDLDTPESEAEEVKGGLNFTSQAIKGELANKVGIKGELSGLKRGDIQGLDGGALNHNETLIGL